jgi:hypothetical protein
MEYSLTLRAHVLICFMVLMISKFIEIKTGLSICGVRDMLWQVNDINLLDPFGSKERIVRTTITSELQQILDSLDIKNTH